MARDDRWLAGRTNAGLWNRFNQLMETRRNLLEAKAALASAFDQATADRLNPELIAVNRGLMVVLQEIEAARTA